MPYTSLLSQTLSATYSRYSSCSCLASTINDRPNYIGQFEDLCKFSRHPNGWGLCGEPPDWGALYHSQFRRDAKPGQVKASRREAGQTLLKVTEQNERRPIIRMREAD